MKSALALVISARQLMGYPTYECHAWNNFSRMAYVEPIIIRDDYHEYILMSRQEYDELIEAAGK